MKCISCGLPLSPTRKPTNCRRCGTPTDADSTTVQPYYQYAYWETSRVIDGVGTPLPNYQWEQNLQSLSAYSPPQSGPKWSGQVYQPGYSPVPPPQVTPPNGSHNIKLG